MKTLEEFEELYAGAPISKREALIEYFGSASVMCDAVTNDGIPVDLLNEVLVHCPDIICAWGIRELLRESKQG